jgi:hypothetical protein
MYNKRYVPVPVRTGYTWYIPTSCYYMSHELPLESVASYIFWCMMHDKLHSPTDHTYLLDESTGNAGFSATTTTIRWARVSGLVTSKRQTAPYDLKRQNSTNSKHLL